MRKQICRHDHSYQLDNYLGIHTFLVFEVNVCAFIFATCWECTGMYTLHNVNRMKACTLPLSVNYAGISTNASMLGTSTAYRYESEASIILYKFLSEAHIL